MQPSKAAWSYLISNHKEMVDRYPRTTCRRPEPSSNRESNTWQLLETDNLDRVVWTNNKLVRSRWRHIRNHFIGDNTPPILPRVQGSNFNSRITLVWQTCSRPSNRSWISTRREEETPKDRTYSTAWEVKVEQISLYNMVITVLTFIRGIKLRLPILTLYSDLASSHRKLRWTTSSELE